MADEKEFAPPYSERYAEAATIVFVFARPGRARTPILRSVIILIQSRQQVNLSVVRQREED